jgi:phosphoesterase RecJ-like protein
MEFIRQENIPVLRQWITASARPIILAHTHPDGDALGATAGLALYLRSLGKDAAVVLPDTPAANLLFILPEAVPCLCADQDGDAARTRIAEADLIILADANAFNRVEGLEPVLSASKAPKVLVDHHLNPDTEAFGLVFSTPEISSASEVVFWLLKALSTPESHAPEGASARLSASEGAWTPEAKTAVGTVLMAGMTTDTNNFANSVFPSTFRMASELLAAGVDRDALLQKLYNSYRENRVRLMGYMQSEQLRILPNGAAYMVLTQDIQQHFDMQDGESEGLVNVPLSIGRVKLSVLVKEDAGHFRVSVRSKKGTSAQQLAQRHFHGGGHENAAGGKILIGEDIPSPEAAPAYLEQILKDYLA